MLIFCPKCGMLISKFIKEKEAMYGVCSRCGNVFPISSESDIKKKANNNLKEMRESIVIIKNNEKKMKSEGSITCPRCGGKSRILWYYTPYGDEDQICVCKCDSCGKIFRLGELY